MPRGKKQIPNPKSVLFNRKKKSKRSESQNDEFKDEVDQFVEQRHKILLEGDGGAESEEEEEEQILGVTGASDSEEDDEGPAEDDDEDSEEDEEMPVNYGLPFVPPDEELEEAARQGGRRAQGEGKEEGELEGGWGSRKKHYEEDEIEDDQMAEEEEAEARRLQKKKLAGLKADEDLDDVLPRMQPKPSEKNDDGFMRSISREIVDQSVAVEEVPKDLAGLSKEEKLKVLVNENPELLELLEDLRKRSQELKQNLAPLLAKCMCGYAIAGAVWSETSVRVRNGEMATSAGVSFLEVKFHLLLSYCINIVFYLLLKAEGRSVKDHPVINQLVKLRVYMEKMKPIDQKLKYQIDKLVRLAVTGAAPQDSNDPLRFKPNPAALIPSRPEQQPKIGAKLRADKAAAGEDLEAEAEEGEAGEKPGIYRPPRVAPMVYEEEVDRQRRREEKRRERARKSSMMKFIRTEFGSAPEEIRYGDAVLEGEEEREIRKFEEENFTRVTLSKKDKKRLKRRKSAMAELEDLEDFGELVPDMRSAKSAHKKIQGLTKRAKRKGAYGGDDF